ncbi:MAG: hypothetical protein CVV27_08075, partial [Candidatus Melainabacteria bacterium HGW-Melainabacteria-1]
MTRSHQRGFSMIELLVALVIGSALLAAGVAFMMRTGNTIRIGQEQTENTSRAQQVMSRMVKELKGVNVDAPPLFNVAPAWNSLPALPHYSHLELPSYAATAG